MTDFDVLCLGLIADDYEEISQIRLDLNNNFVLIAPVLEIAQSLERLIAAGLAQAFRYDAELRDYVAFLYTKEMTHEPVAALTWLPGQRTGDRLGFLSRRRG